MQDKFYNIAKTPFESDFMRKLFIVFAALCTVAVFAGEISVKDFGAAGNGKKDDTAAIRAAISFAVKQSSDPYNPKTVYFPSGTYSVNGTLKVERISLRGNNAVIIQKDPAATTFDFVDFWHTSVKGLVFKGGKAHIAAVNDNVDKSLFFVENCKFFHCRGTALQIRTGAQSTLFTVEKCEFIRCIKSIDSDSDWSVIRDIWIMNDQKMADSAVIVNRHGYMAVDNLLGVPLCNGQNQRWIDNYGKLTATNCRFGGEGGGFTPVYNFSKYANQPRVPNSVVLKECEINAHTSGLRNCAVYCVDVTNIVAVENCYSTFSRGVVLNPEIKTDSYFYGGKELFSFRASGNVGFRGPVIPEKLQTAKINPLPMPEGYLQGKALEKKIKAYKVTPVKTKSEINILTLKGSELVLDNYMDGSAVCNKDLLAAVNRDHYPVCLMRRLSGENKDAPFAEIKHVEVDFSKTPYLTMDMRSVEPAEFAVKMVDEATGNMYTYAARQCPVGQREVNIAKTVPALKGKKTLTFRIYYIGQKYIPRQGNTPHRFEYAAPGSVLEIHEFGLNSKPVYTK